MNDDSVLTRDTQIATAIEQALQGDKRTAPYPIEVEMQGTTATLRGSVESQEAKDAAESIARGVDGVVNVTNELVIDADTGASPLARRDREDEPTVGPVVGAAGAMGSSGGAGRAAPILIREDDADGADIRDNEDTEPVQG